jgi:hypothetical protein
MRGTSEKLGDVPQVSVRYASLLWDDRPRCTNAATGGLVWRRVSTAEV